MDFPATWKVKRELFEKITIDAPMSDRGKVLDFKFDNDLRTIVSGPKMTSCSTCDPAVLHTIAEKKLKDIYPARTG